MRTNEATGFHPSARGAPPDARSEWKKWPPLPVKGLPARLEGDGPVCGLLERSRHACPMDPRRSWLRNPIGCRSPAALSVLADLASEVSSSKNRLVKVHTSPVDGFWRPDFAGTPQGEQCHCSLQKSGRSASAPALARRPFFATDGPQTTLRSILRSVAVTSPVASCLEEITVLLYGGYKLVPARLTPLLIVGGERGGGPGGEGGGGGGE